MQIGCGKSSEDATPGSVEQISQQYEITRLDTSLVLAHYVTADKRVKEFIDQLLYIYDLFKDRTPDTTLVELGDIDGDGRIDTLWSRVTLRADTVRVQSWWDRDGERMWEYELIQPYLWISDAELFQWWENPWVSFTIGVFSAPASLHKPGFNSRISRSVVIRQGLQDLKRKGLEVTEEAYAKYLDSYRGMLISFGHPESRAGLHLWYQPLRRFILYYHP